MTEAGNSMDQTLFYLREAWEKGRASGPAAALSFDELRAEGQRRLRQAAQARKKEKSQKAEGDK
jgi:hypothetical protein